MMHEIGFDTDLCTPSAEGNISINERSSTKGLGGQGGDDRKRMKSKVKGGYHMDLDDANSKEEIVTVLGNHSQGLSRINEGKSRDRLVHGGDTVQL